MRSLFLKKGWGRRNFVFNMFVCVAIAGLVIESGPPLCFAEGPPLPADEASLLSSDAVSVTDAADGSKLISMDFQDVPLKDILKVFSQQAGTNFVSSEKVQDKKVTVFLDKVTAEGALNTILGANGLAFEKQPDTNIYMVKDMGVSPITLQTKIFKLSYATVSGAQVVEGASSQGIENVIKDLLTQNGKIIVDSRTNSLLVTDVPSTLVKIESMLKELDVKTLQVMISAEIMEVSVDTLKRLGTEWGSSTGQFAAYGAGSRSTFWPFKESLFKGVTETATVGSINFSTFTAVLQAIKTDSTTQYLARPRLLTLNNQTAEMKITRNAAVATTTVTVSQGGSPLTTTALERYEVGTTLKVTPHINKDDYITMTVEPEVSRVKAASFGTGNFDPLKRSSKTTIMVKDGETIIIAGLISREDSDSNRKVPFLGEIPIFGKVFNKDETQKSDTEILIFITPHIVKEEGVALKTVLQEELGLSNAGGQPREGGLVPQEPKVIKPRSESDKKNAKRSAHSYHTILREQDSPLSGRELMMETEVLKVKSIKATAN